MLIDHTNDIGSRGRHDEDVAPSSPIDERDPRAVRREHRRELPSTGGVREPDPTGAIAVGQEHVGRCPHPCIPAHEGDLGAVGRPIRTASPADEQRPVRTVGVLRRSPNVSRMCPDPSGSITWIWMSSR